MLDTKTRDKAKVGRELFKIRLVPVLDSSINILLKCSRDELPISIENVRMIVNVLRVLLSEFQVMDCILVNNSLWIPFHIRREKNMGIGSKLNRSWRRHVHVW
jgi:hypothetical protein